MIGLPLLVGATTYAIPRYDEWKSCLNARTQAVISIVEGIFNAFQTVTTFFAGDKVWHILTICSQNAWLPAIGLSYMLQFTACSVAFAAIFILTGSLALHALKHIVGAYFVESEPRPSPEFLGAIHDLQTVTKKLEELQQHPYAILQQHQKSLIASIAALGPDAQNTALFQQARDQFLSALVENIRRMTTQTGEQKSGCSRRVQDIQAKSVYRLPAFKISKKTPVIKRVHALVIDWFSRFPNSISIIDTLARQDLFCIHINGIRAHSAVAEYEKVQRVCKCAIFEKHAKIALLAEALAASFLSGNMEHKKDKAALLLGLTPVECNPIGDLCLSIEPLLRSLFPITSDAPANCGHAKVQPEFSYHFRTIKTMQLEVRKNFVIVQDQGGDERMNLIHFSQTSLLSRKPRGRIFTGHTALGPFLQ